MRKTPLLSFLVILIIFISAQSFLRLRPAQTASSASYFKAYPAHVSVCAPYFDPADSLQDIPALKGWGHYQWKISCSSDSVQFYFNQGISMYYAFHDIEAIASFTKATHLTPDCAMAWYGKALAMGPTINYANGYRSPSGALEAALKSKALAANCTPLEKQLINAMQQRYSADTTVAVRPLRIKYADAMRQVYQHNRQNADVVTLYADALLLLHPWDLYDQQFNSKAWTPEIRLLLEHAIALSPSHPGANHYYIHTMEASAQPRLALASAHLLDTLMPGVAHLTHMPSHIYIRTGDYQRGIRVNDDAVAGYNASSKIYAPIINGVGLYEAHNVHLKANCALMAGNYKIAMEAGNHLKSEIPPSYLNWAGADGNYAQFMYSVPVLTDVRFGKWDHILAAKLNDTLVYASILQHFARGLAFCHKQNTAKAGQELKILTAKMEDKRLKAKPDNNVSAAYAACLVAKQLLAGVIAQQKKQYTVAVAALQKAVAAEDDIIYNEPRDWAIPARQYLGDVLLKAGKYENAMAVFKKDLFINPNNGWSLTGLALAYQATGSTAELARTQQRLKAAWKIKDVDIIRPVF